jgi:hypothetical protein
MWFGWVVSGDGWAAEGVDMGTGIGMSVFGCNWRAGIKAGFRKEVCKIILVGSG